MLPSTDTKNPLRFLGWIGFSLTWPVGSCMWTDWRTRKMVSSVLDAQLCVCATQWVKLGLSGVRGFKSWNMRGEGRPWSWKGWENTHFLWRCEWNHGCTLREFCAPNPDVCDQKSKPRRMWLKKLAGYGSRVLIFISLKKIIFRF